MEIDIKEIRKMDKTELKEKIAILQEQLRSLKFKASENQLKQVHQIKKVKGTIAQMMTVLNSLEK